jgi:hypothetical protein
MTKLPVKQHRQDRNTSKTEEEGRQHTVRSPAGGCMGRAGTPVSSERKVIFGYYAYATPAVSGFRVLRVEEADVLVG